MILQKYEMFFKRQNLFTIAPVYSMRGEENWGSEPEGMEGIEAIEGIESIEGLDGLDALEQLD